MIIIEILKVAFNSLRVNKLRSSLTILGIVVGIFSIIAISTVISMLEKSIESGVSSLGTNTFQIQKWPAVRMHGHNKDRETRNRKNITLFDFEKLEAKLTTAKSIAATYTTRGKILKC